MAAMWILPISEKGEGFGVSISQRCTYRGKHPVFYVLVKIEIGDLLTSVL